VAFFVCSGNAGEPAKYAEAKANFAEATIANFPKIAPVSNEAFGGHYKILGRTVTDTFDINKAEARAETLGKVFTQ